MSLTQPQSTETGLVGLITTQNVADTDLVIYAEFRDKKTGDAREPQADTLIFTVDKDDEKFEMILADSHTTTNGITEIIVSPNGRGLLKYGNLSGSDTGLRHVIGKEIGVADVHIPLEILNYVIRGIEATGSSTFKVGAETDESITWVFANGKANEPYIRYDKTAQNFFYAPDGVSENPFGGTGSITQGDGIDLTAGVLSVAGGVQASTGDTNANYLEDKLVGDERIEVIKENTGGDENLKVKLTAAAKADFDTLTGGGLADALHSHIGAQVEAGEAMDGSSTPKAVWIADVAGTRTENPIQLLSTSAFNMSDATYYVMQSVTFDSATAITEFKLYASKIGSPSDLILDVYEADGGGEPTGSSLSTETGSESAGVVTFTISPTVAIGSTPKQYCFVIKAGVTVDVSNYYSAIYQNTDVYSGGTGHTSSDSGSTWSSSIGDFKFDTSGTYPQVEGLAYLTDDFSKFTGFISANYAKDDTVNLKTDGEVKGFTALSLGQYYKLTTGGVLTSGDANEHVCIAVGTDSVFIMAIAFPTDSYISTSSVNDVSSGQTVSVPVGTNKIFIYGFFRNSNSTPGYGGHGDAVLLKNVKTTSKMTTDYTTAASQGYWSSSWTAAQVTLTSNQDYITASLYFYR